MTLTRARHAGGRITQHDPDMPAELRLTGAQLRMARLAVEVPQLAVAAEVGVARSLIVAWESQAKPTPEACRRFLDALARCEATGVRRRRPGPPRKARP